MKRRSFLKGIFGVIAAVPVAALLVKVDKSKKIINEPQKGSLYIDGLSGKNHEYNGASWVSSDPLEIGDKITIGDDPMVYTVTAKSQGKSKISPL